MGVTLSVDAASGRDEIVPRHVLLVEDDRRITTALAIRLGSCGHRVSHAGNLSEAIDKVMDERPDVVVLDVNLPDGNGLQLAERMRRLRATVAVPLVLITASRDPAWRELAAGLAVPLLEKPFAADELLATIERVARSGSSDRDRAERLAPI